MQLELHNTVSNRLEISVTKWPHGLFNFGQLQQFPNYITN